MATFVRALNVVTLAWLARDFAARDASGLDWALATLNLALIAVYAFLCWGGLMAQIRGTRR